MDNKKEINASKQPITSNSVFTNKTVVSDKFEYSDKDLKYFIGYKQDDII